MEQCKRSLDSKRLRKPRYGQPPVPSASGVSPEVLSLNKPTDGMKDAEYVDNLYRLRLEATSRHERCPERNPRWRKSSAFQTIRSTGTRNERVQNTENDVGDTHGTRRSAAGGTCNHFLLRYLSITDCGHVGKEWSCQYKSRTSCSYRRYDSIPLSSIALPLYHDGGPLYVWSKPASRTVHGQAAHCRNFHSLLYVAIAPFSAPGKLAVGKPGVIISHRVGPSAIEVAGATMGG